MQNICEYARDQGSSDPLDTLTILCTKSKSELPAELHGAWPQISTCLPHRSVQSCHNVCRRRFNPENYGGKWTEDEEQLLLRLVTRHGTVWKEIAEKLAIQGDGVKRTPGNIKDKYKQLGAQSAIKREVGPWTVPEGINLFEKVCIAIGAENVMRKSIKLETPAEKDEKSNLINKENQASPYEIVDGKLLLL